MEVEHVRQHQMHVQNQQIQWQEHIVQDEYQVVRHVQAENIQQQQEQVVVQHVQQIIIVQEEK